MGLGINYSCAEQWRPLAEEALYLAGRLKGVFLRVCMKAAFYLFF